MAKKFDKQQPEMYRVEYETEDGEVRQTDAMAYDDTHDERTALEIQGERVTGIVRRPS